MFWFIESQACGQFEIMSAKPKFSNSQTFNVWFFHIVQVNHLNWPFNVWLKSFRFIPPKYSTIYQTKTSNLLTPCLLQKTYFLVKEPTQQIKFFQCIEWWYSFSILLSCYRNNLVGAIKTYLMTCSIHYTRSLVSCGTICFVKRKTLVYFTSRVKKLPCMASCTSTCPALSL